MKLARNVFVQWGRVTALLCGLILLVGCQTTQSGGEAAPYKPEDFSADKVRVGDLLQIEFLDIGLDTKRIDQTVQEDGSITLLMGKKVIASEKRLTDLQNEIHDLYVPKLYVRMTVNIRRGERFVFVGGEVRMPGKQIYVGELTALKAIQASGDFTIYADKKKIQVIRTNGRTDKVDYYKALKNPKLDLPVYPNDRIVVPLSWK